MTTTKTLSVFEQYVDSLSDDEVDLLQKALAGRPNRVHALTLAERADALKGNTLRAIKSVRARLGLGLCEALDFIVEDFVLNPPPDIALVPHLIRERIQNRDPTKAL